MSANRARIGIVGLGGMGTNHADNIVNLGHDIVAGADVVPDARESFTNSFGVTTYKDFEEMYETENLDGVVVTTPNKFHEPATVAALEAGCDVLCEKPLAHSLESAERIVDAAQTADAFCMVGFHNRFSTPVNLFKDYQDEGRFGDITHVDATYVRRRGIPGVGSWFTDRELAGGGALIDIGVHALDLALYVLDYPTVAEVSGVTRSNFGNRSDYADPDGWGDGRTSDDGSFHVEDSVTALIRCADDTTVSLDVSWAAEQTSEASLTARGTDAGAAFSFYDDALTILDTGKGSVDHYLDTEIKGSLDPAGYEAEDKRFIDAVVAGASPEMNKVSEGLVVQRVIDAIYRSSNQGQATTL